MQRLSERPAAEPQGDREQDSLIARAQKLLQLSGYPGLRNIWCDGAGETLVLRGRVPTYHLKQLAQQVLLADPDLGTPCNEIEVGAHVPGTSYPCTWG